MPKEAQIGYLPQEMEHNEEATILEEAMSAFAETQRLEERVEQLTHELTHRTDYESLEYSRIIEELTAANERIDLLECSGRASTAYSARPWLFGNRHVPDDE